MEIFGFPSTTQGRFDITAMTSKNKGTANHKHCTTMLILAPKGRQQEKPRVCQMENNRTGRDRNVNSDFKMIKDLL